MPVPVVPERAFTLFRMLTVRFRARNSSRASSPDARHMPKPQKNLRRRSARRIEQRIPRGRRPAGHKRLMVFIEPRVSRGDYHRPDRPAQLPPARASRRRPRVEAALGDLDRRARGGIRIPRRVPSIVRAQQDRIPLGCAAGYGWRFGRAGLFVALALVSRTRFRGQHNAEHRITRRPR